MQELRNIGKILHFTGIEYWLRTLTAEYQKIEIKSLSENNIFLLCISGGKTPYPFYKYLTDNYYKSPPKNKNINIFLADERVIPLDDPNSNYGNLPMKWKGDFFATNFFNSNVDDLQHEVKEYEKKLIQIISTQERTFLFDLIILGIGDDGHIASLFPASLALFNNADLYTLNYVQNTIPVRLTITYKTIENSKCIWILLIGQKKINLLKTLEKTNSNALPINRLINNVAYKLVWFALDI
ncbi:MAG: 6-phosphogluconolactonase [Bacteroidota bacterium]